MTVPLDFKLTVLDDGVSKNKIRVLGSSDKPEFCVADVCRTLGIGNPSQTQRPVKRKYKGIYTVNTLGGAQKKWFVTVVGLLQILMTSRSPRAGNFRDWIVETVLPCIFKYGCYPAPAVLPVAAPAGMVGPWNLRFDRHVLAHRTAIINTWGPGFFSVLTETLVEVAIAEEELLRHSLPISGLDLLDASIGLCYSHHRRNKVWARPCQLSNLFMTQRGVSVQPWAYSPEELSYFRRWLHGVYFPKKFHEYLHRKFSQQNFRLAAASAANQVCLRIAGREAQLPKRLEEQLKAAGGLVLSPRPALIGQATPASRAE